MADLPTETRNDEMAIRTCIRRCGAFLTISDDDQTVSFIDLAAKEHLETYARDDLSLALNDVQHGIIALRCLDYVRVRYKQDSQDTVEPSHNNSPQDMTTAVPETAEVRSVGCADGEGVTGNPTQAENGEDVIQESQVDRLGAEPLKQDPPVDARSDNDDASLSGVSDDDSAVLEYPCEFWLDHAKEAPPDLVEEFDLDDDFWAEGASSSRDSWWSAYGGYEETTTNITPLHIAASFGYSILAVLLLDKRRTSEIGMEDSWRYRPLDYACAQGQFDVVQLLVKAGAEVNKNHPSGHVFPLWLAASGEHADIVEYLLDHGADPVVQDEDSGTALYVASENGSVPIVRNLVGRMSNVNVIGGLHKRPLNAAAYNGHIEILRILLRHDVEIDPEEEYQYGSALGAAARKGHESVVKELLQKGWNANRSIKRYHSPLVVAATYGHLDVVKALLEYKVDIISRQLALENASKNGKADVVKMLLGQSNSLPLEKAFLNAASHGRNDVLRLLEPHGTSPATLSTALYQASDSEHESTVGLLLEFGADPDAEGPE